MNKPVKRIKKLFNHGKKILINTDINRRVVRLGIADIFLNHQIKIDAKMFCNGKEVLSYEESVSADQNSVSVELPYFGKWKLKVYVYDRNEIVYQYEKTIGIIAEEYHFVTIMASAPALLFLLKYIKEDGIKNKNGEKMPTYLHLTRPDIIDSTALPNNMYEVPYLKNSSECEGDWNHFKREMPYIAAYIKDLHQLYPKSQFTFYLNDIFALTYLRVLAYGNRLPEKSFNVILISDGNGSVLWHREIYQYLEDYKQTYTKQRKEILEKITLAKILPNSAKQAGRSNDIDCNPFYYDEWERLWGEEYRSGYMYALLRENTVKQWWLYKYTEKDFLSLRDERLVTNLKQEKKIVYFDIIDILDGISFKQNDSKVKKLFKYDTCSIYQNDNLGNKKLVILGGFTNDHELIDFVMKNFGDEYDIIYKKHPGGITEENLKILHEANITIDDTGVPFEIIEYYNPDLYFAGSISTAICNICRNEKMKDRFKAFVLVNDKNLKTNLLINEKRLKTNLNNTIAYLKESADVAYEE